MHMTDSIEFTKGGGVSYNGPDAVNVFRLALVIRGLHAESNGMRLTRGRSALSVAKQLTGLRTNDRAKQSEAVERLLEEAKAKVTVKEAS
jgi:hypothetical protein